MTWLARGIGHYTNICLGLVSGFLGFSTERTVDEVDPRNKFFEDSLTEFEIVLCWSSIPNDALA